MNYINDLINFIFENSEFIISMIKIIITIVTLISPIFYSINNKYDPNSLIRKHIISKEERIINNYFNNLSYKELNKIKEKDYLIDDKIYKLINKHYMNKPQNRILYEITRTDRYKTVELLLLKINAKNQNEYTKTFKTILIISSNYLFHLSKTISNLVVYSIILGLILIPCMYIFLVANLLYKYLDSYIFIIIIIILSFVLFSFGNKENNYTN